METKVMQFLIKSFEGAVSLIEKIVSGVPGAETAIVWGVFVTMVTGFLIIPIRGYGHSDRARAGAVMRKEAAAKRAAEVVREDQKHL